MEWVTGESKWGWSHQDSAAYRFFFFPPIKQLNDCSKWITVMSVNIVTSPHYTVNERTLTEMQHRSTLRLFLSSSFFPFSTRPINYPELSLLIDFMCLIISWELMKKVSNITGDWTEQRRGHRAFVQDHRTPSIPGVDPPPGGWLQYCS